MKTQPLRQRIDQLLGRRSQVARQLARIQNDIQDKERELHLNEKAREVIRIVAQQTQEQLQYHIQDITSLALEAVFVDPYQLKIDFVQRRNRTECDLLFERNGLTLHPIEASGVGAVDIAAFALRIASWSMSRPRTRPVIFMDEPFKHLSTNYQPAAGEMIKQISSKLGIQFLIVTHEQELTLEADRVFQSTIKNGITKIRQL